MKTYRVFVLTFLLMLVVSRSSTQSIKPVTAGAPSSTELTIYNADFALIREERTMNLAKGFNTVVVPDIPATIDGTSLHFSSLTEPSAVKVLEQNFQYDLIHHAKLLEKYLGKEVEFIRYDEATKKEYSVKGKLLSTGWIPQRGASNQYYVGGQMVAEINGKVEINPSGRLVLPALSEGLVLKPQLEWIVSNTKSGEHTTEISYIADHLSWHCDYVALLHSKDSKIDLTGWVTLNNNCGTSFNNAGLKLVAGDVNVVPKEERYGMMKSLGAVTAEAAQPQFQQKELFEYKLYTLQRRTNLANNETKQIELTSGRNITGKKVFMYDGLSTEWRYWMNNASYRHQGSFGQQSNTNVGVFVTLNNDEKSGLGLPLPKGKVRVYQRDDEGKEQFIGEDWINHTPKDEEIKLYLGNAFDLVGSRVQKDFKTVISGHVYEETFEIKVRNHKNEAVEVLVYEHPWRWNQWEIVKTTVEYEKIDQSTITFPVRLKKDEEKVISYTIRYSW